MSKRPASVWHTGIFVRFELEKMEATMDWNRIEGNWKQVKGQVKEKWGKLTRR